MQAGILDLLLELQEQHGIGILMITHDLGVARLISDRIHVMKDGAFVESGEVQQIVDTPPRTTPATCWPPCPSWAPGTKTREPTATRRRPAHDRAVRH